MKAHVAHLSLPKLGERVNGDAVVVRETASRELLLAVIDGLGHGPIAAEASMAAVAALNNAALDRPVLELMQTVHAALRGTRGAVATLCMIRGRKLEACAVGNVQLNAAKATVPLILSAGVLGSQVTKFRVCEAELRPGVRVALFSDGISTRFRLDEGLKLSPREACQLAMDRHRKNEDDATILIADMDG